MRMHFVLPARDAFAGLTRPFELPQLGIISEIALARLPELNVIDASRIQLNFGPDDGKAHDLGFHLYIASTDIVAIDAVALGVHKHAYRDYKSKHFGFGLPFTYRHLDDDKSVWDHGMIRHGGEIGLGAMRGSDVNLATHRDYHEIDGFSPLMDSLVDNVLAAGPGGKFDAIVPTERDVGGCSIVRPG
jgi:hypothetical protein